MVELPCTVGHKIHAPCFYAFHMKARVMTFVANCTAAYQDEGRHNAAEKAATSATFLC